MRICYAGTYERDYPRNRLVIDALRRAGARVEEAHVPVFERRGDKSRLGPLALAGLAARLALAYLRLGPEVALRLLRCDALALGYIGQLDVLLLALVARLCGRPVVFNPLVTLTDTLVDDRQRFRAGSLAARSLAALDRAALCLADVVLVDSEENGHFIAGRFGVPRDKLLVVPVGADESVFFPAGDEARPQDGPDDAGEAPLDVLFVGKFIPLHGIATIVAAAAELERRRLPVRVELVGRGQTYAEMRALAARLDARALIWTDWVPSHQLGERLRRADVALGIFGGGAKAGRVVPNKVYQSLACGVATVTRDSPAARGLLRAGESALLVPPDDPAALADAIERLLEPELRRRIARDGLAAYRELASGPALAAAVEPAVTRLLERRCTRSRG